MEQEKNSASIDLLALLGRLKRYWAMILLCGVVLGGVSFVYNRYFVTPLYEANCRMIVTTREDANNNVTGDQLSSAQQMVDVYSEILLGRDYLEQVVDDLNLKMTYGQLKGKISISSSSGTQIMDITVRDADLKQAERICEYIYDTVPDFTKKIVKIGSLDPAGSVYPVNDGRSVYPNVKKSTLLAFLIGCMIPVGLLVLLVLLENTYKTDTELKNDLDLPVLGVIPSLDCVEDKRTAGAKRKRVR